MECTHRCVGDVSGAGYVEWFRQCLSMLSVSGLSVGCKSRAEFAKVNFKNRVGGWVFV